MPYFDHSATTPVHPDVLELMTITQRDVYGNPSSVHAQGRKAKSIIEKARRQVAAAIGAKPDQIIFTSGGSESNNQVLRSVLNMNKKHIIGTAIEHLSLIHISEPTRRYAIGGGGVWV